MKRLLHGVILSGALLAAAHPADAGEGAPAKSAPATGSQDKDGGDRTAGGAEVWPFRSNDSIQAVFDRHKRTLYKIYKRELQKDPAAGGELLLQLTIAPDGHLSSCAVERSTLNSRTLLLKIKEEVCSFNFGAQRGVPDTSILYPLDFRPPT